MFVERLNNTITFVLRGITLTPMFGGSLYIIYLKMLGLYLYTLRISHKSANMLGILNKLTLQKEWQHFVTNNVFFDRKLKTQQQQNKKSNIKTSAGAGN